MAREVEQGYGRAQSPRLVFALTPALSRWEREWIKSLEGRSK
jgi:hypothetical protein